VIKVEQIWVAKKMYESNPESAREGEIGMSNLMEILTAVLWFLHANRQTDGRINLAELMDAYL
jgi:hypothetical protein